MRDWMYLGVYGTVLASTLLAALQHSTGTYTPYYDAAWIGVAGVTSALAHGYAHHMASHTPGSGTHRWRQLARALFGEWPVVAACLPTVLLLVIAGLAHWPEAVMTNIGLGMNAALLFTWGTIAALRVGYRRGSATLIGFADAMIGMLIAGANTVIH
ncbi:hypothetical protein ACWCP6_00460 [Streptomyces sp. NPDC002004]